MYGKCIVFQCHLNFALPRWYFIATHCLIGDSIVAVEIFLDIVYCECRIIF